MLRELRMSVPARQPSSRPYGSLLYQCNICGSECLTEAVALQRENPTCSTCQSTPRYRSLIHLLSTELFGESVPLPDFPVRKDVAGLGLSDWSVYAKTLDKKFNYTNTFRHQEPRLDITAVDPALVVKYDFLIASEMFQLLPPPISVAFHNARRLLKPHGFIIFTVPYAIGSGVRTREHFPRLFQHQLEQRDGKFVLINHTRSGDVEVFENLVFHGAPGSSLEMRLFSEECIVEEFGRAGFGDVKILREPHFPHGVFWPEPWSLPMVARVQPISQ